MKTLLLEDTSGLCCVPHIDLSKGFAESPPSYTLSVSQLTGEQQACSMNDWKINSILWDFRTSIEYVQNALFGYGIGNKGDKIVPLDAVMFWLHPAKNCKKLVICRL